MMGENGENIEKSKDRVTRIKYRTTSKKETYKET